jgi:hypothetical protein
MFLLGTDITLVAHSIAVGTAMEAAALLEKEGVSCEVGVIPPSCGLFSLHCQPWHHFCRTRY